MATYSLVRSQVHTVACAAPEAEIDADVDLVALHVGGGRCLGIVRVPLAAMGDADVAEPDRQEVAIGRLAGLADGHDDAAPIGVLAGDRRLDQRRIGDGQRDALGRTRDSSRR